MRLIVKVRNAKHKDQKEKQHKKEQIHYNN